MRATPVVSDLICEVSSRLTWATNSLDACSATNPAVDSLFLCAVRSCRGERKAQSDHTARPFDPDTQLQNNLNRWYDARVGRWLSEDPIGFAAGDGNLYRYALNGPVFTTDYDGLWFRYSLYGFTKRGLWRRGADKVSLTWNERLHQDHNDVIGIPVTKIYEITIPYWETCGKDGLTPDIIIETPTGNALGSLDSFSVLFFTAGTSFRQVEERTSVASCSQGRGCVLKVERIYEVYDWITTTIPIIRPYPVRIPMEIVHGKVAWRHEVVCCR